MRNHLRWMVLVAMAAWSCFAAAGKLQNDDPGTSGQWYGSFGLGGFSPRTSDQLNNPSGQYSLMLGMGYRYSKNLSFDFDLWAADQRVDTPPAVVAHFLGSVINGGVDVGGGSVMATLRWSPAGHK